MRHGRLSWITGTALVASLAIPTLLAAEDHPARHRHYRAVDLGTFGGPQSFINPASVAGSPNQINEQGVAVGGSATSIPLTPTSNPFICGGPGGVVPFVDHAFERQNRVHK